MSDQPLLLARLKQEALSRPRRVIFDNDGSDRGKMCTGPTPQDLINVRARPAIEADVDTYIYTTGWGFGIGLHDSHVGSILASREGLLASNRVADFLSQGTDCLRIQADYVKQAGKEFFWGMRMNDTHDRAYGGIFMPENDFKNSQPDVMFGHGIRHGGATAVDYLDQRVRDFAVAYAMDVVDRYPINGIFLDFFRHPIFFRSNAQGLPATTAELDAMTAYMRQLKEALDARRVEHESYYLVSVRLPDSVDYCRAIGLDIERWLADDLVDILFVSSYLQLNDWDYSAELAHRYNFPVYPSLDESRLRSELARHRRNSLKAYYGRIMNVWDAGCDGVMMFNNSGLSDMRINIEHTWFAPGTGSFQEALAATVRGRDHVSRLSKTYFASFRGIGVVAGGALPHHDYIRIPTLNHDAPISIAKGGTADVPLRIGDDLQAAASSSASLPELTASLFISGNPAAVRLSVNGRHLGFSAAVNERADTQLDKPEYLLKAHPPATLMHRGHNLFTLEADAAILLLDLWLDIDYPTSP